MSEDTCTCSTLSMVHPERVGAALTDPIEMASVGYRRSSNGIEQGPGDWVDKKKFTNLTCMIQLRLFVKLLQHLPMSCHVVPISAPHGFNNIGEGSVRVLIRMSLGAFESKLVWIFANTWSPRKRYYGTWSSVMSQPTPDDSDKQDSTKTEQDRTPLGRLLGIRTVNPGFYSPSIEVYSVLRP